MAEYQKRRPGSSAFSMHSAKPLPLLPAHSGTQETHTVDISKFGRSTPKKPARRWRFYGAFASLCIVNFVAGLDGSIVSVAIPVGAFTHPSMTLTVSQDHCAAAPWNVYRSLLDWDGKPAGCHGLPAEFRVLVACFRTKTADISRPDALHTRSVYFWLGAKFRLPPCWAICSRYWCGRVVLGHAYRSD